MSKKDTKKLYITYSLVFLFIVGVIAGLFYLNGKSLIAYNGDGFREYYQSLIHYSTVLKETIKNIFINHQFVIPQMDFVIGEGNDLLQTMHFILIGDPMYALSVLIPKEYMYIFFDICNLLKIYLSGLAFIYLCKNTNKTNWIGIFVGSIVYCFSGYSITVLTTHPFFLNSLICLPLVITGIEKVLKNEKPYVLIFNVFYSAISNLYFFYMIVILVIVYTVTRVIVLKEKFIKLIHIGLYSLIGVLLAGVIVLPMFYAFIDNSRLSIERIYATSYGIEYFKSLIYDFIANSRQVDYGGFTIVSLLGLTQLIKRRNNKTLIILTIISFVFLSFPFFGRLLNGMSYVSSRWQFCLPLLFGYIVTEYYEDIINIKDNIILYLIITIIYFGLCFIFNKGELLFYVVYFVGTIGILLIGKLINNIKLINTSIIICTIVCILFSYLFIYSSRWYNYSSKGTDFDKFNTMYDGQVSAIESIDDETFFRYSSDSLYDDESVLGTHSSTQFYWSISNNYITNFRKNVGLSDHSSIHYSDYDDRYSLMSLASIKYFVMGENDKIIPYGFEYLKEYNGYKVYINKNSLPLIYGYTNYITEEDFNVLNTVEKNEILTSAALVEDESQLIKRFDYKSTYQNVDYTYICNGDVTFDGKSIIANEKGSSIDLKVDSDLKGEYYLVVENLDYSSSNNWSISTTNTQTKTLYYKDRSHPRYSDRHEFIINLGYKENIDDNIHISFEEGGSYYFDSLKVVCQPLDNEIENINSLNNVIINNFDVSTNLVKADIKLNEDEVVCIAIPYAKGWKAYVNGEEVKLLNVNGQYMGLELTKGSYNLELEYSTPYLKLGAVISITTLIAIIINRVAYKKKRSSIV